ncbi:serine/arginine repetitive matrix protein 1-like [Belonocnema kinseyi]|uniref:serine/arginine repetitive matrix protein 1-like n=1 Tax=Belonocnema kinseyi TaxID=2817044 RepID=UPI00143DF7B8|nr:serine/arginine repetitive matrix protein 1-like [Belonocnema kinseyi]
MKLRTGKSIYEPLPTREQIVLSTSNCDVFEILEASNTLAGMYIQLKTELSSQSQSLSNSGSSPSVPPTGSSDKPEGPLPPVRSRSRSPLPVRSKSRSPPPGNCSSEKASSSKPPHAARFMVPPKWLPSHHGPGHKLDQLPFIRLIPKTSSKRIFELRRYTFPVDTRMKLRRGNKISSQSESLSNSGSSPGFRPTSSSDKPESSSTPVRSRSRSPPPRNVSSEKASSSKSALANRLIREFSVILVIKTYRYAGLNVKEFSSQSESSSNSGSSPGVRATSSSDKPERSSTPVRSRSRSPRPVRVRSRSPPPRNVSSEKASSSKSPLANRLMVAPKWLPSDHGPGHKLDQLPFIRLIPKTASKRKFELRRYTFPVHGEMKLRKGSSIYEPLPTEEQIVISTSNGDVFAILETSNCLAGMYIRSSKTFKRAKINTETGRVTVLTQDELDDTPCVNTTVAKTIPSDLLLTGKLIMNSELSSQSESLSNSGSIPGVPPTGRSDALDRSPPTVRSRSRSPPTGHCSFKASSSSKSLLATRFMVPPQWLPAQLSLQSESLSNTGSSPSVHPTGSSDTPERSLPPVRSRSRSPHPMRSRSTSPPLGNCSSQNASSSRPPLANRLMVAPKWLPSHRGPGHKLDQLPFIRLIPKTASNRIFVLKRYSFPVDSEIKMRKGNKLSLQSESLSNSSSIPGISPTGITDASDNSPPRVRSRSRTPPHKHYSSEASSSSKPILATRLSVPLKWLPSPSGRGNKLDELPFIRLIPKTASNRIFELRRYTFPVDTRMRLRRGSSVYDPLPTQEQIVLSTSNEALNEGSNKQSLTIGRLNSAVAVLTRIERTKPSLPG